MSLHRSELPKAQKDKEPQRLYPTFPHIPKDLQRHSSLTVMPRHGITSAQQLCSASYPSDEQPNPAMATSPCEGLREPDKGSGERVKVGCKGVYKGERGMDWHSPL